MMMKTLIETPPRTIMEVYKGLPEGTLAELIDNVIYMAPSPVFDHQDILMEISFQLREVLKKSGAKVVISPFDVFLDEKSNAVQPDILIILERNKGTLEHKGHFHGVPDLIVEILSPGNKSHDLLTKKTLYERFGVKEYWVVDPESKSAIVYSLEQNQYKAVAEELGKINSPLLKLELRF